MMTVQVRSKRVESIRRRRTAGRGRTPQQTSEPPARARIAVSAAEDRRPVRSEGTCSGKPLTNDRAVYHCQCGFVFEAPVSTSVGCPNCSATQAW
jgi:hypothetical protein